MKKETDNITSVGKRLISPTPKFWQKVRNISGVAAAAALFIVSTPLGLPLSIIAVAKYVIAVSSVTTILAQATTTNKGEQTPDKVLDTVKNLSSLIKSFK